MEWNHPYIDLYKRSRIIVCCGAGTYEEEFLKDTKDLEYELKKFGIDAWFDYWGFDCDHDWPWWRKQLPYFMSHLEPF
jgi:esterase/lipase superfamily enzyme